MNLKINEDPTERNTITDVLKKHILRDTWFNKSKGKYGT